MLPKRILHHSLEQALFYWLKHLVEYICANEDGENMKMAMVEFLLNTDNDQLCHSDDKTSQNGQNKNFCAIKLKLDVCIKMISR